MNLLHCTQRRLQHGASPPEPLSCAQTRTETAWKHCACARQLNMNAASRLKTSHVQVRITPVFLLSCHVSPAYQSSVLCGGGACSSRRRLCVLNASARPRIEAEISSYQQTPRKPAGPNEFVVGNVHASCCSNVSEHIFSKYVVLLWLRVCVLRVVFARQLRSVLCECVVKVALAADMH